MEEIKPEIKDTNSYVKTYVLTFQERPFLQEVETVGLSMRKVLGG